MATEDTLCWLSPREAAALLRVSLSAVRQMIRQRRLPARRLRGSRLLRIARADVEALLEPLHREPDGSAEQ
jgi:excisionase family DNA binding protein